MSGGWPRLFTASGPGPRRRRAPGHPRTPPGAWLPGPRPGCRHGGRFRGDAVCRGAVLAPPGAQARVGRPCSRAHPAQTSVPAAVVGAVTAPEPGARCGLLNADREARERVLCEEAGGSVWFHVKAVIRVRAHGVVINPVPVTHGASSEQQSWPSPLISRGGPWNQTGGQGKRRTEGQRQSPTGLWRQ